MIKHKYDIGDIFWVIDDKQISQVMINGVKVTKHRDILLGKKDDGESEYGQVFYRLATETFINTHTDITEDQLEREFFTSKAKLIEHLQDTGK